MATERVAPKRLLIDSMVIDLIADTPGLLARVQRAIASGLLTIVETHILRTQLSATRCDARRMRLLEVYETLHKIEVTTQGFVVGVSPLAAADLGYEGLERLKTGGDGGMHDALLAATAAGKADALVTDDIALGKKVNAQKLTCVLWGLEDFRRLVQEHDGIHARKSTDQQIADEEE